ncbi:hypothetical protein BSL78_26383 [Apostichopus japonicus]|uniref:Uncharacterized protein n=1 Tax=Stichopus japonicus TaxID=307972 RepID=A0A2G8JM30_STIJA|nr:hypothetical protein BSL78_26383 [Apostichopus japonicus]
MSQRQSELHKAEARICWYRHNGDIHEDDAVDNVNLATTSLLPMSQGIATDDVSLTPADVSITANMTGGSGHDTTEDALALEFLVIIITTVIIILALLILIAAIVFYCCKKRSEKPSRFVKFKKGRGKYDKMDLEMGNTLPRNDPGGGAWIFKDNDGIDEQELEPMNLDLRTTHLTNDNYDPEVNGNIDISPSISDYHSGTNHGLVATLELDDDDNDLNVNPMYASPGLSASHGSTKDSGIHGSGSDELGDPDRSIRSDNDLQSFADDTVEL